MVPARLLFRQAKQAATSSAADVEMDRLLWALKQLFRCRKLQRQLEEATEGIDVLAQRSTGGDQWILP